MWLALTLLLAAAVVLLATTDALQRTEPLRRVAPVIGRFAGILRWVKRYPNLRGNVGPFNDIAAHQIRYRALSGSSESSFGAAVPAKDLERSVAVEVFPASSTSIDPLRCGPVHSPKSFLLPRINFGALGFGPVSGLVIESVGAAARVHDCLQNTGEDGLTSHHRASGARLVWQIGTGYAGCRDAFGRFDEHAFQQTLRDYPTIVAIEVKLSQGAKPGAGGFLPAAKVTPRVARTLGVEPGRAVVSPPEHSQFDDFPSLLAFLDRLRTLSQGLPVGIKLCLGSARSAGQLAQALRVHGTPPDFIVVDGAEGGTGAAPYVLQHHAGLPARYAVPALHQALKSNGLRDQVRIIATSGAWNGFHVLEMIALGADSCYIVRAAMVAIGCISARQCHTGKCPTGIATQNPWRRRAIVPQTQGEQLSRFYGSVVDDVHALMRAAGIVSLSDLNESHLIDLRPSVWSAVDAAQTESSHPASNLEALR
ncbi:FMN-binding glutamate synthase family protein [Streptomyces sp. NBC_00441]|uniref:FMN-binding glutamate synthase family protein n=1 Tax=Streptomyces sp. NBC_00441 TaxID=2975742 RepID=UPI002E2C690E|nr:FMN-binding glutamate synthase family protein [Streptomyces sp. NBC_00441]